MIESGKDMNIEIIDDQVRWQSIFKDRKAQYSYAGPFPFIVIDNFLNEEDAKLAASSFPQVDETSWTNYIHVNEKKYGLNKRESIPSSILKIINTLQSPECLHSLTTLTGISGLIADETLAGGGLHQMYRGGFLNIHSDFLIHPTKVNLKRRINFILFLSTGWKDDYGGELELWDKDMTKCIQSVQPKFNRCVIFNTDEYSYHGCPERLNCPQHISRKTLALYYYTEYAQSPQKQFTHYRARPTDHNKLAIYLDNKAIAAYSWLKRKLNLNDEVVSLLLRLVKKRGNR